MANVKQNVQIVNSDILLMVIVTINTNTVMTIIQITTKYQWQITYKTTVHVSIQIIILTCLKTNVLINVPTTPLISVLTLQMHLNLTQLIPQKPFALLNQTSLV